MQDCGRLARWLSSVSHVRAAMEKRKVRNVRLRAVHFHVVGTQHDDVSINRTVHVVLNYAVSERAGLSTWISSSDSSTLFTLANFMKSPAQTSFPFRQIYSNCLQPTLCAPDPGWGNPHPPQVSPEGRSSPGLRGSNTNPAPTHVGG